MQLAVMSAKHRFAASAAVTLSFLAFGYTALWLVWRSWHWSNGAATVTMLFGAVAIFLVSLSFRDQSTRGRVYVTFGLLAVTALLYLAFPHGAE
jgi:hypothetical protein